MITASQQVSFIGDMQVFHVVNPHIGSWSNDIAGAILAAYPRSTQVQPVRFDVWVDRLRQSVDETLDIECSPAACLVDFYAGLATAKEDARMLTSYKAEAASTSLRNVGPVNSVWLRTWMAQWSLETE